ncbi:MAG: manganese efflux pump MntP family protein [Clostridium sp.]|uniref:manganese efflux pump MntP n=1 Tax=Clostridium sp. TaxID=1506 RepID=UPI003EE5E283
MLVLTAFLFSLSSNLDNLVIGISYGIKKEEIPLVQNIIIGVIIFIITFIAMIFGKFIERYIPKSFGNFLGAIVIIFMGIYFIIMSIKDVKKKKKTTENFHEEVNVKKNISIKDSLILGGALGVNNLAVGVAASVMGLNVWIVCLFTFITSILTIIIGEQVGDHVIGKLIGKYDDLISGLLLVVLGIIEII